MLNTTLRLEFAAFDELPEDQKKGVTISVAKNICTHLTDSHIGRRLAVVAGERFAHDRSELGTPDGD